MRTIKFALIFFSAGLCWAGSVSPTIPNVKMVKSPAQMIDTYTMAEKNFQAVGATLASQAADCYQCYQNRTLSPPPVTCTSSVTSIVYSSNRECPALGATAVDALKTSMDDHNEIQVAMDLIRKISVNNTISQNPGPYVMDIDPRTLASLRSLRAFPGVRLDIPNDKFYGPSGSSANASNLGSLGLSALDIADIKAKAISATRAADLLYPAPVIAPDPNSVASSTATQNGNPNNPAVAPRGPAATAGVPLATVNFNGEPIGCATCQSNFTTISQRLQKILTTP